MQQPLDLICGYTIVGEFASAVQPLDLLFGPDAEQAVSRIVTSPPPRFAEEILQIAMDEQAKNFCGPFMTKAEVDDRHGIGAWRPMERFLIHQPDGKTRAIDNCRRTNQATLLHETITTVNID